MLQLVLNKFLVINEKMKNQLPSKKVTGLSQKIVSFNYLFTLRVEFVWVEHDNAHSLIDLG